MFLLGIAAFLILRYLPALADIWADRPADEYIEDPIAFWLIALLDLGIFLQVAAVAGVALLQGVEQARTPMYAVVAWFVLVSPAVAAMAFTMELRDDPHGSLGAAIAFTVMSIVVAILAGLVLRPVLAQDPQEATG